jgi:hypothetical protein
MLSDEVRRVLQEFGRPADLAEITRRMTGTRHASRVRFALCELGEGGRAVFEPDGRGRLAAVSRAVGDA